MGESNLQINLDESQELNWNDPNSSTSGYLVGGNNTFSFRVEDPAGNQFNRSFEVVLDSTKPEIFSSNFSSENSNIYLIIGLGQGQPLMLQILQLSFEVTPDIQSMCIDLISNTNDFVIENCKVGISQRSCYSKHLGIPSNTEFYSPFILDLEQHK